MGQESESKRSVMICSSSARHTQPLLGIVVPIIPGIMPIQTYSSFLRLIKLCGTKVPPAVTAALEPIKVCIIFRVLSTFLLMTRQHDDQKVKEYGVTLAVDIIRQITNEGVIRGVHLCTLNLERSVQLVLERLQWVGGSPKVQNKLILVMLSSATQKR